MHINKHEVLLLRKALDHYIKFQLGVNTREASEYEDILKMLEDKLFLLDWQSVCVRSMLEALVTAGIAAFTGMSIITQRLHGRINELDRRVDEVQLRVAQDYVTKGELSAIMERMESHLIRIEEKMDKISLSCNK